MQIVHIFVASQPVMEDVETAETSNHTHSVEDTSSLTKDLSGGCVSGGCELAAVSPRNCESSMSCIVASCSGCAMLLW